MRVVTCAFEVVNIFVSDHEIPLLFGLVVVEFEDETAHEYSFYGSEKGTSRV